MGYPITAESQIYQNIALLTIHDEFIIDVEKIREEYQIDWIVGDEEKKADDRFFAQSGGQFGKIFDHHLNDPNFREFDDYDPETNQIIWHESEKYKKFKESVSQLIEKYKLPKEYHESLDVYIQQGFIPDEYVLERSPIDHPNFDKKEGCVVVKVYPSTTKKDYDLCWKISQFYLEDMKKNGPKKRIDNFTRDIKIVQMQKEGMTADEIAKKINEEYSLKGKNRLTYDRVNIIIHRIKKQLEKFITHQNSKV